MQPVVVNADYDEILAGGGPKPAHVQAIECLAFWVQDAPIKTQHTYSAEFLAHVAKHSGRHPSIVRTGDAKNWWGELSNLSLERKINSKIWARQWWQQFYDFAGSIVSDPESAFDALPPQGQMLIKRDHGMSGRGHWCTSRAQWPESLRRLQRWFPDGVIVEPIFERVSDLSALWVPEEQRFIFYRNLVDEKFQWRGCVLENDGEPVFSPQEKVLLSPWSAQLKILAQELLSLGYSGPFSVDAFFFADGGQLKFYPCSEINARRTMGWIAYQLLRMGTHGWGELRRGTPVTAGDLELSPRESRFRWVWSSRPSTSIHAL
jgi:hypothetical protein